MGLDATVYCDCLEQGRLRCLPQGAWNVQIAEDGSRVPSEEAGSLDIDLAFDEWNATACEHEQGILAHQYLGNTSLIGVLRRELSNSPERFTFILTRVIYNAIHAGDCISVAELPLLNDELTRLGNCQPTEAANETILRTFVRQMTELLKAATCVGKPISF